MIKVSETGLQCEIIMPAKNEPRKRIVAKVFDGKEIVEYLFGPTETPARILAAIPRLYKDKHFLPKTKVKGITLGEIIEFEADDEILNGVLLSDGCIIVFNDMKE